jgi:hypothetical protein
MMGYAERRAAALAITHDKNSIMWQAQESVLEGCGLSARDTEALYMFALEQAENVAKLEAVLHDLALDFLQVKIKLAGYQNEHDQK